MTEFDLCQKQTKKNPVINEFLQGSGVRHSRVSLSSDVMGTDSPSPSLGTAPLGPPPLATRCLPAVPSSQQPPKGTGASLFSISLKSSLLGALVLMLWLARHRSHAHLGFGSEVSTT